MVRALLLGGPPFEEDIVMWWNFIGRTHDEIVEYRRQWQAEIGADEGEGGSADSAREPGDSPRLRFGRFPPDQPAPLPAPALPNARLRPRKRAAR